MEDDKPAMQQTARLPLAGIRVIDWTQFHQGPGASALLADLGAEVIKVEDPVKGDQMRGYTRVYGVSLESKGVNVNFEYFNRNKRGIAVNLKHPRGREILYRLVEKSDVLVHNFLPSVVSSLGMAYEDLRQYNPRLIYGSGSGFGPKGPASNMGAFDALGLARSGILRAMAAPDGEPASFMPGLADESAAIALAWGVVTALLVRERWGIGQQVDSSLLRGLIAWQASPLSKHLLLGYTMPRRERKNQANPLYNLYRCRDGQWIFFGLLQSDRYWADFCSVLEIKQLEGDPRFGDMVAREENRTELMGILDSVLGERTFDEWEAAIQEKAPRLLYCKVQSYDDLLTDPQVVQNEYIVEAEHPALGKVKLPAFPFGLSETPAVLKLPAPAHGQHTEEILIEICGYSWADIGSLKEDGVIP